MIEIRAIEEAEVPAFRDVMLTAFGDDSENDPDGGRRFRTLVEHGRAWMAFDDGAPVATAAAYALELGIPGGTLPMAGLTMVAVLPTHRRRGILTRLIAQFLADARAHEAPIAGLWASEAMIYGRYDFGVAAEGDMLEIDARALGAVAEVGGGVDSCRYLEEAFAREALPPIYGRALVARPGVLRRSATWWRERRFLETAFSRGGNSKRRYVVASRGDEAVGYVVFRQGSLGHGLLHGKTHIIELVACDPRAEASLWRFVAAIDLFPAIEWSYAPVDTLVPWIAANSRAVVRKREDTLWLRVEDVATTLAARRYACDDGTISIAVDGESYVLEVRDGRATCTPGTSSTVAITRAALGSIYLGGVRAATLARAGKIAGDVDRLDRMFSWATPPWCPEVF